MQLTYLDKEQTADVLMTGQLLVELEGPGTCRTHVVTSDAGRDVVLVVADSGDAMMFDQCQYDSDAGGSIHHHARADCDG